MRLPTLPALLTATALLLSACGSSGVSAEDAERLIREQAAASGLSDEEADCVATEALKAHEPDELVGTSDQEADPAVVESIASITVDCILGDEAASPTTVATTQAPTTTAPTTTAPAPTTAPPTTAATTTTAPATTVPEITEEAFAIFCRSSYDAAVGTASADLLPDEPSPAVLEAYWTELAIRTEIAVATAPNEAMAAQPLAFLDTVSTLNRAFREAGYDINGEFVTPVDDALADFQTQSAGLADFLVAECGDAVDLSAIQADAQALADQLTNTSAGDQTGTNDSGNNSGALVDFDTRLVIADDVSIEIEVPIEWTDERTEVTDIGFRVLAVAPDVDEFLDSWLTDGVMVTVHDDPASIDSEVFVAESPAASQCTADGVEEFNDGVYVGSLHYFIDCPGGVAASVLVSNNVDNTHFAALEIQLSDYDYDIETLLLATFYGDLL